MVLEDLPSKNNVFDAVNQFNYVVYLRTVKCSGMEVEVQNQFDVGGNALKETV